MEPDQLAALLAACEKRLLDCRREVDAAIDLVRQCAAASERDHASHGIEEVLASHKDDLVNLVMAALENGPARDSARQMALTKLYYRQEDDSYRIGRRQPGLTEMERRVLDIFWQAMPQAVSRDAVHAQLYPDQDKATTSSVDVFVSKLRQKLKLASGGEDFIRSVRGKGWKLNPELCRTSADFDERDGESESRSA